ncbi:tRNA(Ile)-lysidine synthetase [Campylobacter cuniculorum DSM 23162 = LMG 24588]|uniref:tRNA(Ile)-lysidine synthase n=2 Tax=Campylobacter cuniculorum TaxID=374106 RepID=A0A1W6BXK6_9BACT|nr:tRNA(Ile)-lysidine synthetase [Campylobacter cuniculorum DSM 23162 = LMG 24588]
MIKNEILEALRGQKNLLAFSYGSDSTALFYILMDFNIEFDLVFINYKTRIHSDTEELEARHLAQKFHKKIFIQNAPYFKNNFEKQARDFRYAFFEKLCCEEQYQNLILAHQLNDLFEWFLMQFSKGAGLAELIGMKDREKCEFFTLVRPLLFVSKDEILAFLKQRKIKYFNDESNENEKYFRNFIRKHFAKDFITQFSKGVKKSFEYLGKDLQDFLGDEKESEILEFKGILICKKHESLISKAVKKRGVVMSWAQRKEALKGDCVVSSKVGIVYFKQGLNDERALIFNYELCEKLPKSFKEKCRQAKIPRLLRAYLYHHHLEPCDLNSKLFDKKDA